ncbi:GNAT family N-acetyltransferase [Bailinhaonella thermotolerans]|uniref:GNAT family N-acetyltransferase n=1 Tax=Bailinhaonella thermotolerans TaxID=1070861 RepID=A0A3A4BA82_9ACTN|nr:GNAT family N-acetyltransferase [Bailinhaonella thermotolerans]RJL35819.1 GNAT family N-acetyltransferase [Bailinhaonella thermotolerans]
MPLPAALLRPATSEDVPALLSLMDSVHAWLLARGRPEQWGTVPFSRIPGFPDRVADWTRQGVITLAERDGRCVGLLAAAPMTPPRVPAGAVPEGSMFIHTVMTDRGPGGRGVAPALLAEAERLARACDAPALALDHWAGSPELARVYEAQGYARVTDYTDDQSGTPVRNTVRVRPLPRPAEHP